MLGRLHTALADDNAASLLDPIRAARPYLATHPSLADQIDTLTEPAEPPS
ncbi:hypothetical protein AB0387_20935 [Streptomyces sp. NPDC089173]